MGLFILILQSFLNFSYIKATIAFIVISVILAILGYLTIVGLLVQTVIFFILSFLVERYEGSVVKWFFIIIAAGLLLGVGL